MISFLCSYHLQAYPLLVGYSPLAKVDYALEIDVLQIFENRDKDYDVFDCR